MSSTIPYIGSKISLISNSEIRYEGILYTINTQESTIALQSVKTFGTEGRKMPEIPPSSEIYDFIIFRGQDIKDLTVLEGAQTLSPMLADPAIESVNQRPAGGCGKDSQKGGGKSSQFKGDRHEKGGGSSWGQPSKGKMSDYSKGSGKSDGWGYSKGKWDEDIRGSKGRWDDGYKGKGQDKGYSKGGKKGDIHAAEKGKGKGKKGGKDDGKSAPHKGKGKDGKGYGKGDGKDAKGNRRGAAGAGGNGPTVPVGELLPEENAAAKRELAEEFDVTDANKKFEKISETTDGAGEKKPLAGYDKAKSFFDNISCEATDRAADSDRQKIDRDKARQYDKETFGDTRRPPRPVGVHRGKGKGKGGSKGGYRS